MTNVNNWIWMDESKKAEDQIKWAIASEAYGYLNGINDCGLEEYPPMTRDGWAEYIRTGLNIMANDNMSINGTEYRHMRFIGKQKTEELIETYIDNCEAIKPYII